MTVATNMVRAPASLPTCRPVFPAFRVPGSRGSVSVRCLRATRSADGRASGGEGGWLSSKGRVPLAGPLPGGIFPPLGVSDHGCRPHVTSTPCALPEDAAHGEKEDTPRSSSFHERPEGRLRRAGGDQSVNTLGRGILVFLAVGYATLFVALPFASVFVQAFSKGAGPLFAAMREPEFLHAAKMTMAMAAIAVPINTVFGVLAALALVRTRVPFKRFWIGLLDVPFTISPIVTGLMFVLLYGRTGLFAPLLRRYGFQIVFALPGMALATLFVTLPFVVRELIPVLEELDAAEEEAAASLGAQPWRVFWDVTLPNVRWALLYGVILTNARAMGEFGAVSVVSGNIIGHTQTLTLFVESAYKEYNTEAAFAAAVILSILALLTLVFKVRLEKKVAQEAEAH